MRGITYIAYIIIFSFLVEYFNSAHIKFFPPFSKYPFSIYSDISENEITPILTTSEGGEWGGHVFRFGGPSLRILNVNILICICIRSYDIGRSFDPIFMKFTWLVRVHSWVNSIVFGNNRPNRTTDMGENVTPKPVFRV